MIHVTWAVVLYVAVLMSAWRDNPVRAVRRLVFLLVAGAFLTSCSFAESVAAADAASQYSFLSRHHQLLVDQAMMQVGRLEPNRNIYLSGYLDLSKADDQFVDGLKSVDFPSPLRADAQRLIEICRDLATVERSIGSQGSYDSPQLAEWYARWDAGLKERLPLARKIRKALGLVALPPDGLLA